MSYSEVKDRSVSEVMTEQQYEALRETVFLSALHLQDVLSEAEQMELLNKVFGMSQHEIELRLLDFRAHQKKEKH